MTKQIRYADVIRLLEKLGFVWERRSGIGASGQGAIVFQHPKDEKALILLPNEPARNIVRRLTLSGLEISLDNSGHFTRDQFTAWRLKMVPPRNGAVRKPKARRKKSSTDPN